MHRCVATHKIVIFHNDILICSGIISQIDVILTKGCRIVGEVIEQNHCISGRITPDKNVRPRAGRGTRTVIEGDVSFDIEAPKIFPRQSVPLYTFTRLIEDDVIHNILRANLVLHINPVIELINAIVVYNAAVNFRIRRFDPDPNAATSTIMYDQIDKLGVRAKHHYTIKSSCVEIRIHHLKSPIDRPFSFYLQTSIDNCPFALILANGNRRTRHTSQTADKVSFVCSTS